MGPSFSRAELRSFTGADRAYLLGRGIGITSLVARAAAYREVALAAGLSP